MPARHLAERHAGARMDRETHRGDELVGLARGLQHAALEIGRRERAGAAARAQHDLAAERREAQRNLRARIGVGDRAAHGAAVAGLEVADEGQRAGEQRELRRKLRPVLEPVLGDGGADLDLVAQDLVTHDLDVIELGKARDVDHHRRFEEAQVEHRHQRLPARHHLGLLAVLREEGEGLGDSVRAHIVEAARFHGASARPNRRRHRPGFAAPLAAGAARRRPSRSKNCRMITCVAPSSSRPPTAATLPPIATA